MTGQLYGSLGQLTMPRKAAGDWWLAGGISPSACVAAYQAKGAASYAASKVNLANPGTYDAAEGVAPTWDAVNGWTFNKTNQYLNTAVVPNVDQTWSAIIRMVATSVLNSCTLFSRGGVGKDFGLYFNDFTTFYPHNGRNVMCVIPTIENIDAVLAVVGNKGYKDGSLLTGTVPTGTPPTTQPLYIGAGNNNGVSNYFFGGKIKCVAIYGKVLSAPEVLALTNAMNAL